MAQGIQGARWGKMPGVLEALLAIETDECVLWPHARTGGYGRLSIDGQDVYAHVVSCERTHGPRPVGEKYEAAHSCGVRHCVNQRHLRWATCVENAADMIQHGRTTRGRGGKLTAELVREIRERYAGGGISQRALGAEYSITHGTVGEITRREIWNWLD